MNNLIQRLLSMLVGIVFSISLQAQRYLGGDISLLPSYQKQGTHYLNELGKPTEALQLFKDEGWNIMRVRLFVEHPTSTRVRACVKISLTSSLCQNR